MDPSVRSFGRGGDMARVRPMPAHMEIVTQERPRLPAAKRKGSGRSSVGEFGWWVTSGDGGGWSRPLPPVIEKEAPPSDFSQGSPKRTAWRL